MSAPVCCMVLFNALQLPVAGSQCHCQSMQHMRLHCLLVLVLQIILAISAICSAHCPSLCATTYQNCVQSQCPTMVDGQESKVTNARTCLCLLLRWAACAHTRPGKPSICTAQQGKGFVAGILAGVCNGNWPSAPAAGKCRAGQQHKHWQETPSPTAEAVKCVYDCTWPEREGARRRRQPNAESSAQSRLLRGRWRKAGYCGRQRLPAGSHDKASRSGRHIHDVSSAAGGRAPEAAA